MNTLLHLMEEWPWPYAVLAGVMHLAAFFFVTFHCLRFRRDPTSALFWLLLSWFIPFLGPLAYLMFGIYKVPLKGRHKADADQRFMALRRLLEEPGAALTYWRSVREASAAQPASAAARDLNGAMNSILEEYPLLGGNDIELLIGGEEAYPRMLDAIRGAKHHIHFQTFIIKPDAVGREFMELLAEKARAGVAVRLMYDRFGSTYAVLAGFLRRYRGIPNLRLAGWTQANVFKRQFQVNLRNHRKILVVDNEAAFTGGINLSVENQAANPGGAIRDYHFALRGPIVQELQFSFLRDWQYMTGEATEGLLVPEHFRATPGPGRALVRVVNSGPASEMEAASDVFFLAITAARRQLLAVTPYFAPPTDILHALRAAAMRGVDVRLIVPRENNHPYAGWAGRALYDELLCTGVRIYERQPPFMHAKALVVDDVMALVGSANLDVRSLRLNYETDLAVYDETFISSLTRAIHLEMILSQEITLASWRSRPVHHQLLENFCSLLIPVL